MKKHSFVLESSLEEYVGLGCEWNKYVGAIFITFSILQLLSKTHQTALIDFNLVLGFEI